MTIPEKVQQKLGDSLWKRPIDKDVNDALSRLGVPASDDFAEFYRKYWGPFRSRAVGHELLDVVQDDESILSNTGVARQEFAFPERYIVLSTPTGYSVLVYDVESGSVFDVDFEGGDELLRAGTLSARWPSWKDFILEYFS